jgi:uncharacterized protein (DUF1697 family)
MDQAWVALLRGINLGSRNRVPMPALRTVFEDAGCDSVSTFIQSGNVLFTKRAGDRNGLARKLERAIADAFDVPTAVVLRTAGEIAKVARSRPFGADNSHTLVAFLANAPPRAAVRRLQQLDVTPDRFKIVGSDVFLHYPNGVQGARLSAAALERHLDVVGTTRSWKTVTRLAELAAQTAGKR